jgi:hypothetical protein
MQKWHGPPVAVTKRKLKSAWRLRGGSAGVPANRSTLIEDNLSDTAGLSLSCSGVKQFPRGCFSRTANFGFQRACMFAGDACCKSALARKLATIYISLVNTV